MEPADLIARVTAKTSDMDQVGASSVAGLSGADAAIALAGLDRGPYLLALVMWAGDMGSLYPLENQLWGEMASAAARNNWIVVTGEGLLRDLSRMAVHEMVSPKMCSACSGRGIIHPRGRAVRNCGVCSGSGVGKMSGRERARSAGMCKSSWHDVWGPRYEREGIKRLRGWEVAMGEHVRRKLSVMSCATG